MFERQRFTIIFLAIVLTLYAIFILFASVSQSMP